MAFWNINIQPSNGSSTAVNILLDKGFPMDTSAYWWNRYPERATKELSRMTQSTNSMVQVDGNKLVWFEIITTNFGNEYLIAIETGSKYPFKMPKVFVREPKVSTSKHLYGDGSLCLMHSDDYNSKMSLVQIRNQAASWLLCYEAYKQTGEWVGAERPH